ncbi:hypothetical protein Ancab_034296 [Ancistrocladus abbreviatus]
MAVADSSSPSQSRKKTNNKKNEVAMEISKQRTRSKSPGVRVVGGRIYDSQNGKTCHQCRQKTMDFSAECTNEKGGKLCTIKFCHKCLKNRYGENAEEAATLNDWKCPKCRGICNCSFCMKKKGHPPTGILVHMAKATGFASVSEMLHVQGPENVSFQKIVGSKLASPRKLVTSDKDTVAVSPSKRGKENIFNGASNTNLHTQPLPMSTDKKPKKVKLGDHAKMCDTEKQNACFKEFEISQEVPEQKVKIDPGNPVLHDKKSKELVSKSTSLIIAEEIKKEKKDAGGIHQKFEKDTNIINCQDINSDGGITLPQGKLIINMAAISLPPEDVGHALQFLEFCATFGEVLSVNKGQPESVLRDIMCGRSRRSGKCSSVVQFHIQLLTFLQKDLGEESPCLSPADGKSSWLHSLKKCLSESNCALKDTWVECVDKGVHGYEMLNCSQKLRLLTFLCDETLGTMEMRRWIEDQNLKFAQVQKEARGKLTAAKEKEKLMKRKMQDKIAKAILAKNGAPLTVSEHEAIVSKIKNAVAEAHEEMVEARGFVNKRKQTSDAVRTEPTLLDAKGFAYWRLKGYSSHDIVCQDVGCGDLIISNEKWFSFDAEEEKVIKKYILLSR